jgi:hypothetical protein
MTSSIVNIFYGRSILDRGQKIDISVTDLHRLKEPEGEFFRSSALDEKVIEGVRAKYFSTVL